MVRKNKGGVRPVLAESPPKIINISKNVGVIMV